LRLDHSDDAAMLRASFRSCAAELGFSFSSSPPASVAAEGDVVVERGIELGFLFVRSGILAGRRLLEDLYSFR